MRFFYYSLGCIFIILLSIYGEAAMAGAAKGYELFINGVFPALFPFAVCILCLRRTGGFSPKGVGGFFSMLRLLLIGAVAGNPTGSMLLDGAPFDALSMTQRSVFSALFNLASPVFIAGSVCSRLFGFRSFSAALLLMSCHYGSAALLFSLYYLIDKAVFKKHGALKAEISASPIAGVCKEQAKERSTLLAAFPAAVSEAALTMLKLCGTIVFFVSLGSLIDAVGLLEPLHPVCRAVILGMLEMTSGVAQLASSAASPSLALPLCCFLISFGGVCIMMQASAVSRVDAPVYLFTKLVHGLASALFCTLLFPLFIGGASPVFEGFNTARALSRALSAAQIALLCFLASIGASLAAVFAARRTRA